VTSNKIEWRGWLRALPQVSTFFALAMIALIWGAVEFDLNAEHDRSEADAIRSSGNLARVFEDHIVRLIKDNDRILRQLQLSSVRGTLSVDFDRLISEVENSVQPSADLTLVDARGILTTTSEGPPKERIDLNDREYFKVHFHSPEAGLYISAPVRGRISKKWSIQLTRALRTPHGAFAGVVVASIRADKLARFYELVELGPGGAISLVGLDGIIRASAGLKVDAIGRSMAGSELMRRVATTEEGSYTIEGVLDGVRRLVSYRVIEGFPLALWIGRAEREVFGVYWRNRYSYRLIAAGLTLFILIVVSISISHRERLVRTREDLRASEALAREKSGELELTLEHMSQGIMMIDADQNVAFVNRRAVELLDLPESVHSRPKFADVMAHFLAHDEFGKDDRKVAPQLWEAIKAGDLHGANTYQRTRPNGVTLEIRTTSLPAGGLVRTFTDISERKRNENKIAHMAHHDALTGLANRVLLRSHVEAALGRQRRKGEDFALLVIDLDRFKPVNDTFGHAAGDELLRCVAQRLRACVREVDVVARLGGDEFAILQGAAEGRDSAAAFARRLVAALSEPYSLDGHAAVIGASIGIAWSADSADIEELFHNADLALYRVKSEGRNGYRLFEPEMDVAAQMRRHMEAELREALARGEFEIHYQPIFDLATRDVASVEALLRWNHPERGRISPADFMPLAEDIGLMPSIDAWVLETACTEAAHWPGNVRIAINLSPAKFKRRTLVDTVRRALAASQLAARRLELEISERTLLQDDSDSIAQLRALHDLGVRIALDDFGTCQSSLSDLRAFPFDKIKIDQSFVGDIGTRADCAAIVAAIAGLGRSLGAETTAEGVETQTQADLVRAAGCTQAQGYLYSQPLSAGAIMVLLTEMADKQQAVA
jgi:diguanylate cyclase (GGDEF)-like protein